MTAMTANGKIWMVVEMTKQQEKYLTDLYENCRSHASDTMEFWEKTTDAFHRITEMVGEQDFTELAVDYYMKLQGEFCEALRGAQL